MKNSFTIHIILWLLFLSVTKVSSQNTFVCQGQFYIKLGVNGLSNLNQIDVDPITNNVTFTNLGNTSILYDAIGYRSTDNFIYGMHPTNENFYRIDPSGTATLLTNLSTINTALRYFAGDITPNGDSYVAVGANNSQFPVSVNLITVDMVNPGWGTTQIPLIRLSTGGVNNSLRFADIAFDPISGTLYGFDNTNDKLVTIDMNTGVIDDVSFLGATGVSFLSSLFFDVNGNLWGYGSDGGPGGVNDLFFINKNTGNVTYVTSGPSAAGTDGCSCPYAVELLKDVSADTVRQCGTFQYTFTILNASGSTQTIDLTDSMPTDFTVTNVISNPYGGTVNGLGTNQFDITGMTVPIGRDSIIVEVQVSNNPTLGVYNNQATISGLPASLGSVVVSDNPNTLQLDDATPVTVEKIVDLGLDIVDCQGVSITLDAGSNNGQYLWSDGSTSQTLTVTTSGDYAVTVTENGCSISDTINVTIEDFVNLGNDTLVCEGESLTLNTLLGGLNYTWSDNSTNPSLTVATPGTYSVTVTNGTGCVDIDSIVIGNHPTVDLGSDEAFVCENTIFTITPNITQGTYVWQDGSTNSTYNPTSDGMYSVTVTDINGCISSDTMAVFFVNNPDVDLGNDTTLCVGTILDATIPNAANYLWQDGSTNSTFTVTETGTYSVVATDTFGCQNADTILVQINEITVDLGADTLICSYDSIQFNVTQPNMTYLWQDGTTTPTYTAQATGTYAVLLTDNIGCQGSDTILITLAPEVNLGGDRLFKCDSTEMTIIPNLTTGNFVWQDGTTDRIYIAPNFGTYSVTFTDIYGCVSSDMIELIEPPIPPIDLGADTTLCFGDIFTLSAFDEIGRSYLWQDGSTNSDFTVTQLGTYSVEITDTNGCVNSDMIMIDYFLPSLLDLGNDTTICEATTLLLTVTTPDIVRYTWQDGSTNSTFNATDAGTYYVEIEQVNGCILSDTIQISILPEPRPVDLPLDTTVCNFDEFTLNAFEPNATEYTWQGESAFFAQNDPKDTSFIVRFPGLYQVNIANRCASVEQTVQVIHEDCSCTPYIPNAFTPNNDGQNDEFKPMVNCPIENYQMMIFDRWGNKLFETTELNVGWNGTFNGNIASTGVYVWRIQYESSNESGVIESVNRTGDVTILR